MATTQFELVTPSAMLFTGQAEMIVCRTVDGEIAFLADHMPYIGALDASVVRVVGPVEGSQESVNNEVRFAVRGGFVEVKDNQVIMLADRAELGTEVDQDQARRDEEEASDRSSSAGFGEPEQIVADADLRWAQVRLEAATGA